MGRKLWCDEEMFLGPCLQLYKISLIHYHMLERKRQWLGVGGVRGLVLKSYFTATNLELGINQLISLDLSFLSCYKGYWGGFY